jgi:hypothetical protein
MLIQTLCFSLARRAAAAVLGGVVLWQVAEHCGSTSSRAIVHVSNADVDVTIDDARYHVEAPWEAPIVCVLRPGSHTLRMLRGGRVVCEEEFALASGEERILTAWDVGTSDRSPAAIDEVVDACDPFDSRSPRHVAALAAPSE